MGCGFHKSNVNDYNYQFLNKTFILTEPGVHKLREFTVVWVNETSNTNTFLNERNEAFFQSLTTNCIIFRKLNEFFDWMKRQKSGKLIVILSSSKLDDGAMNQIVSRSIVKAIFIYEKNRSRLSYFSREQNKRVTIRGFSRFDILIEEVDRFILESIEIEIGFPFSSISLAKNTSHLNKDFASFMWCQILVQVLNRIQNESTLEMRDVAQSNLIKICRNFYADDPKQQNYIKNFEMKYKRSLALLWYSKEYFLHDLVNQILRTEDLNLFYSFRFYLSDLYFGIETKSKTDIEMNLQIKTVYRTLMISRETFDKISTNEFLMPNGFIFASTNEKRVLQILEEKQKEKPDNFICLLFEININEMSKHVSFVNVSGIIDDENETEILFNIGSVFKMMKIENKVNFYKIYIETSDENFRLINNYFPVIDEQIKNHDPVLIFGQFMIDMGQYKKANTFFQGLLQSSMIDDDSRADIFDSLGHLCLQDEKRVEAKEKYQTAYKLRKQMYKQNDPHVAQSLINLGIVASLDKNYHLALNYFRNAEEILKTNNLYLLSLGIVYNEMAKICLQQNDLTKAEQYYENVRQIHNELQLPENHVLLAQYWLGLMRIHAKYYQIHDQKDDRFYKIKQCYQCAYSIYEKIKFADDPIFVNLNAEINNIKKGKEQITSGFY